jgi:hypothetical protein
MHEEIKKLIAQTDNLFSAILFPENEELLTFERDSLSEQHFLTACDLVNQVKRNLKIAAIHLKNSE